MSIAGSWLAAGISKLERNEAVTVPESFSVAVEWPGPSLVACKAGSVTELCSFNAHPSEVAPRFPLGFAWEPAIANPHTFWRWHTLVHWVFPCPGIGHYLICEKFWGTCPSHASCCITYISLPVVRPVLLYLSFPASLPSLLLSAKSG